MTTQEQQADDSIATSLIGVPDPDIPIYRIFPLWFFEEALRLRQLVLVSPRSWEDPYEIIGDAIAVDFENNGRIEQEIINQSLPPVFAQCWSATEESDTLLRAYSRVVKDPHFRRNTCPRDEGVRVKSTPRKLLHALMLGAHSTGNGSWFLGAVNYMCQNELQQEIANAIGQHGLDMFSVPTNRARLLLLKRKAFSHEAELRVLFVQQNSAPVQPILRVPIDPLAVFDEISFDPRLELFERREREAAVRRLGFKGTISDAGLYQRTLLQVNLLSSPGSST
ncbi:MAG: hypothetical protein AzoDbin1_01077 [Azoarcus sp.]|nr:hypothetical protein [Azoarcus sp.]